MRQPLRFFSAAFPAAVSLALVSFLAFHPGQSQTAAPTTATLPVDAGFRDSVGDPWTPSELLAPAALQEMLTGKSGTPPLVLSIGPGAVIKGSEDIGAAHEPGNLDKLKKRLSALPRSTPVVIYCGCCPFVHCPNIRPAFSLLKEMQFSQAKLLDIEHNIKTDWIARGYAVNP